VLQEIVRTLSRKNINFIFLFFITVFFTLFTYRSIFHGKLLGDPFDARLMIVLHEHWWKWYNGDVALRDTQFFYPFDKALGYSDVFLIQGSLYSFIRLIGFDLAISWSITTISLLIIGNIGWVVLSRKHFNRFLIQLIFTLTIISSLSFVNYFTLNPNSVGYSYLSWIILFYQNIKNEKVLSKINIKVNLFIICLFVYALSCWYATFFIIYIWIFKQILDIFYRDFSFFKSVRNLRFKYLLLFSPIHSFFLWLFVYIYISILNQPTRPIDEMFRNSPNVLHLANGGGARGTGLQGAYLDKIYTALNLNLSEESNIGIGLVGFCLFIFLSFWILKNRKKHVSMYRWWMTILITYFTLIPISGKFSVFGVLFENIPGFNSIRSPSRFVILLGFFVIFISFYILEKLLNNTKFKLVKFLTVFVLIFLFLDQQRTSFSGWDKTLLRNPLLFNQFDQIQSQCDYFYFDYPGGWWYDQIEAITFSTQIGIPTVNGYSGAFPPGYPTEPFNSDKLPFEIFKWINQIDKNQVGCFLTGISAPKILNQNLVNLDLIGFENQNEFGDLKFNKSLSPNPYFYIINFPMKDLNLSFSIKKNECVDKQRIKVIEVPNKLISESIISNDQQNFKIKLTFKNEIVKRIELVTDSKYCQKDSSSLRTYFYLNQLKIN